MPLELKPPGDRGRKYWYIRGTLRGKRYDRSTSTTDKSEAECRKAFLESTVVNNASDPEIVTFAWAAEEFKRFRKPKNYDVKRINAVSAVLSDTPVNKITQSHIVSTAEIIRPGYHPATINRDVVRPIASVMHYAADNKWCPWMRFKTFKAPRPEKRAVGIDVARKLYRATEGQQRLLILWLFKHGDRITDTLNITGDQINVKTKIYRMVVSKTDKLRIAAMDDEVIKQLKIVFPKKLPEGRIFTWGNHHNVYRWLKPLCQRLKIEFTPHMARHSILTWIGAAGGSVIQIKGRGGHSDIKSAEPYLSEGLKSIRDITAQFKIGVRHGAEKRK